MKKTKSLYHGHRFPAAVISSAVRWYFRFQLSLRDIEELLFERGVIVSYAPEAGNAELHRFSFQLEDEGACPYVEMVSLRTAKVIVAHLGDGNAFTKMLREIVAAAPSAYDSLIGR